MWLLDRIAMRDSSDEAWGDRIKSRGGLLASGLAACRRALEAESDRWFLWLPVLFAGGILTYSSLPASPIHAWPSPSYLRPSGFA